MKDIVTYINEVSKGLVQRAYNKATGAQKNRLKKLYKEIYGSDVAKSDVSHIKFDVTPSEYRVDYYGIYTDNELLRILKTEFSKWSIDILNNIKKIDLSCSHRKYSEEVTITIDDKRYWYSADYDEDSNKEVFPIFIDDSNLKNFNHKKFDGYDTIPLFIAKIYKEVYKGGKITNKK